MLLPLGFKTRLKLARVVSFAAVLAIAALSLNLSFEAIRSPFGFKMFQKSPGKGLETAGLKPENKLPLVLNEDTGELSLVASLSRLCSDSKQNVRTWAILSNQLERSPPFSLASLL